MLLYKISDGSSVGIYQDLASYPYLEKILESPQNYNIKELYINTEGKVVATRTISTQFYVETMEWVKEDFLEEHTTMGMHNDDGQVFPNFVPVHSTADVVGLVARVICLPICTTPAVNGRFVPTLQFGTLRTEVWTDGGITGKIVPKHDMTWGKLKAAEYVRQGAMTNTILRLDQLHPGWRRLKSVEGLSFSDFAKTRGGAYYIPQEIFVPELIEVDGGTITFDEEGEILFYADVQGKK